MAGQGRRGTIAVATAGAIALGLGLAPTAGAQPRTLQVTLLGGTTITVTLDIPPGTPLDQVHIPGVKLPIISIVEVGAPASTPTVSVPGVPSPQPTTTTPAQTSSTPAPATGSDASSSDASKPQTKGSAAKQSSTGKAKRTSVGAVVEQQTTTTRSHSTHKAKAKPRKATPLVQADGVPKVADPTFSLGAVGAAPVGVPNFFIDKFRIPPFLLSIYQAAGTQYGVQWEVLAAINEIETDYGRNLNVSTAGAEGWMQFMPATWKTYGVDANGDGRKDPYNPVDAIFGAARYLKAAGAAKDVRRAVFAYNHAGWYVDSVMMRAKLIGGLPADLVGSLTGLTEGRFPVAATSKYANGKKATNVFARAGAAVIAVQDARVVRVGNSPTLGKYVRLRDEFGNTYTYSGLKKIAPRFAAPQQTRSAKAIELPKPDPAPTAPASAGRQLTATADALDDALRGKQRLFANPEPAARTAASKSASATTTFKRLKRGAKVPGGTVLGRIGTVQSGTAPHVKFTIRPAGRGAPLINPKPILDGWKLLESSATYRAEGKNPFWGRDAKNPSIGQILLLSKQQLQRRVLTDPNVTIYAGGKDDIRSGAIDRRVLATLEFLSASGLKPTVSCLRSGHSLRTTSGNISEHSTGDAVDIAQINGIPILGHQGPGSITDLTIRRLLTLQGTMKPHQIISLMTFDGADNTLAMADHADHIHVGFRESAGTFDSVLKPGQWSKLIDRLGSIENPTIPDSDQ